MKPWSPLQLVGDGLDQRIVLVGVDGPGDGSAWTSSKNSSGSISSSRDQQDVREDVVVALVELVEVHGRKCLGAAVRVPACFEYRRGSADRPRCTSLVTPTIVVVGAAARDLDDDDPRGWRLGGGVTYCALVTARLGRAHGRARWASTREATDADELELLRDAGVDVRTVGLDRGPVFRNIERPEGRLQHSEGPSGPHPGPLPSRRTGWALPDWILAPVAAELPRCWADAPSSEATVAVGWQGLLREPPTPRQPVRHVTPRPAPIIARATSSGVSRDDVDPCDPVWPTLAACSGRGRRWPSRRAMPAACRPSRPASTAAERLRHYPADPEHATWSTRPAPATCSWRRSRRRASSRDSSAGGSRRGFDLLVAGDRRVAGHRGHRAVRRARPRGGPRTDARGCGRRRGPGRWRRGTSVRSPHR